jgi:zinc protease
LNLTLGLTMKKTLVYGIFFMFVSFNLFAKIPDSLLNQKLSLPVEKYVLDNGLTVLLSQDHHTPFVTVNIWYYVGSINEQSGKTGLAHFFEHLMFEGSKHVAEQFRVLENAGAFDVNASTNFGQTIYHETLPKNKLELPLSLESSRMSFLTINQEKLDEQRKVVLRELEQRILTTPYGEAIFKLWQNMFGENHPFHGRVIGSPKDLEKARLEDVQSFYDQHYGPSNASLALVGDFKKEEAKTLINKYFATLPKTKKEVEPILPSVVLKKQEIIHVEEKLGKLPFIRIQWVTPALFKPGDAELDVLSIILTGGEYGRLTKAITRNKHLASSTSAYQQSFGQLSVFTIDALLNQGIKEQDVLQEIDNVLLELVKNPPTIVEIDRARNSILTKQFFGLQSLGNRAELLQTYERFANNPDFLMQDVMRYQKIDPEALKLSALRYLPIDVRKILIATPLSTHVVQKGN